MVVACFSPPPADFDDVFVPALIDVGILETLEGTAGIATHLSRLQASRPVAAAVAEPLRVPHRSDRLSSKEGIRRNRLELPASLR